MTVKNFNCDVEEENDFKQKKCTINAFFAQAWHACLGEWLLTGILELIEQVTMSTCDDETFELDEILFFCPYKKYLSILQSLISFTGGTCQNWGAMHRGCLLSIYGHALPRCCQWWSFISMWCELCDDDDDINPRMKVAKFFHNLAKCGRLIPRGLLLSASRLTLSEMCNNTAVNVNYDPHFCTL